MARFENGWVAIGRRLFLHDKQNNEFFGDLPLVGVWILLIAWANIQPGKTRGRGGEAPVLRGDVLTSQGEIARQLGLGRQVVRRCLSYLEATQRIELVANQSGLHVRICNYEKYQSADPVENQPANPSPTSSQPAANQQPTRAQPHIEQENKVTREQGNKGTREHTAGVKPPAAPGLETKSGPTWAAYRSAYYLLHGADPLPNKTALSQCCKLVDLIGKDAAPEVAEWYVTRERDSWVLSRRHPIGILLRDWQKYHTDWKTQTKITNAKAKSVERDDSNEDAINRYLARKHAAQPIAGG